MSHYRAGLSNWSANHRILNEAYVENRVLESLEAEVQEQRMLYEDMEEQAQQLRESMGPVPRLLREKRGEEICGQSESTLKILSSEDEEAS